MSQPTNRQPAYQHHHRLTPYPTYPNFSTSNSDSWQLRRQAIYENHYVEVIVPCNQNGGPVYVYVGSYPKRIPRAFDDAGQTLEHYWDQIPSIVTLEVL